MATALGPLKPYAAPEITRSRVPVDAESSVTELPFAFATHTWLASVATALGPLKAGPKTFTPESDLVRSAVCDAFDTDVSPVVAVTAHASMSTPTETVLQR